MTAATAQERPQTPEGIPMRHIVSLKAHVDPEVQQGMVDTFRRFYGDRLRAVPETPQRGQPLDLYVPWNNIYFDGKVRSANTVDTDGRRATVGEMDPGEYEFTTTGRERLLIQAGRLGVKIGSGELRFYSVGEVVEIPASTKVKFVVLEQEGTVKYYCEYPDEEPKTA